MSVEGWTEADRRRRRRRRPGGRARRRGGACSTPTSRATACAAAPTWRRPARLVHRLLPTARSSRRAASRGWRIWTRCAPTRRRAVVVGKALYEQAFTVEEALARVRASRAADDVVQARHPLPRRRRRPREEGRALQGAARRRRSGGGGGGLRRAGRRRDLLPGHLGVVGRARRPCSTWCAPPPSACSCR